MAATTLPVRDTDADSFDLASPRESAPATYPDKPKWALMAVDPSGKRHLLVRQLVSGIESDAMVFRELGGGGSSSSASSGEDNNARRLSVAKWNKKPHGAAKMARGGREVRIAQLVAGSGCGSRAAGRRFAALLAAQDMAGGYRESWWRYYNLGDMHDVVRCAFGGCDPQPPLSLVFRWAAQCLEAIACLNARLGARHMDLHPGNIFFHMGEDAARPDAVVGDFGHARLEGERPPLLSAEELGAMGAEEREARLSPPLNSDEAFGTEDYSWRPRWDAHQFHLKIPDTLLGGFSGREPGNELLFGFFRRLAAMSARDEADRKLPEAQRPPVQDLAPLVRDAWALERMYADTPADRAALRQARAGMLAELRAQPSEPQVFGSERHARATYERHVAAGMLRVVNLDDDGSVEAAAAELAALKVAGTAYVAPRRGGSGASSPSSSPPQPSTTWTPATRGVAEVSAFAEGDASAVEGVVAARDAEERRLAQTREELSRRYGRQRGLWSLFRRS